MTETLPNYPATNNQFGITHCETGKVDRTYVTKLRYPRVLAATGFETLTVRESRAHSTVYQYSVPDDSPVSSNTPVRSVEYATCWDRNGEPGDADLVHR